MAEDRELILEAFADRERYYRGISTQPDKLQVDPERLLIAGMFDNKDSCHPGGYPHIYRERRETGEHYARTFFITRVDVDRYGDKSVDMRQCSRLEMKATRRGYNPYYFQTKLETGDDGLRMYFLPNGEEAIIRETITGGFSGIAFKAGWVYSPEGKLTGYIPDNEPDVDLNVAQDDDSFFSEYMLGPVIDIELIKKKPHILYNTYASSPDLNSPWTTASVLNHNGSEYLNIVQAGPISYGTPEEIAAMPRVRKVLIEVPLVRPQNPIYPESIKNQIFTYPFLRNPEQASVVMDNRWTTPDLQRLTGYGEELYLN